MFICVAVTGGGRSLGVRLRSGLEKGGWLRFWESPAKKQLWLDRKGWTRICFFNEVMAQDVLSFTLISRYSATNTLCLSI